MTKFWNIVASGVVVCLLGGSVAAGGRGLLIAQANETTTRALQAQIPALEERMQAVEAGLNTLKGAVDTRAERDSEYREEQRAVNRDLTRGVNELLRRPR